MPQHNCVSFLAKLGEILNYDEVYYNIIPDSAFDVITRHIMSRSTKYCHFVGQTKFNAEDD